MINVVYIVANLDIGGTEGHISQVVPELDRKTINPVIFTLIGRGELAGTVEKQGVNIVSPSNELDWHKCGFSRKLVFLILSSIRLFFYLKNNRPDIVHFFLPMPYVLGGFVSLLSGVKLRIMSRRSLNKYQEKYLFLPYIERFLHRRMVKIFVNSKAVLADLQNEEVKSEKLDLIYNGVKIPALPSYKEREEMRKLLGIESNDILIVKVANLIPYKGHKDLLNAMHKIYINGTKNWKVICIGRDILDIKSDLVRISKDLNIHNKVDFIGSCDNVLNFLLAADISVLCSHQEGFSNSVLEGMSCGLPSIVTNVGGNSEAIRDGIDGHVVSSNNPHLLSIAIQSLMADKELRSKMGVSARIRARKRFSMSSCVHSYEKSYLNIIKNQKD